MSIKAKLIITLFVTSLTVGLFSAIIIRRSFAPVIQALLILLVFFILLLFIYFKLIRGIIISLNKLKVGTEIIGKGQLNYRIDLNSRDELGDLAASFNKMAEDLRKSQNEIIAAKEYTENILRSTNDALIVISRDGFIRTVNAATCVMLGYAERELIGQPLKKILKPDADSFIMKWLGNLNMARLIRNLEEVYLTKDGKEIPVLLAGSLMFDANGRIEGIVCAAQDITERKRAEEQLLKAKDHLEIEVAERTRDLRSAFEQLKLELLERQKAQRQLHKAYLKLKETQFQLIQAEKMEVVGRLASAVAHEVKNPLAVIIQGVEYLLGKIDSKDENVQLTLQYIKEAVERADNIVEGLLDFSSSSRLNIEKANINEVVEKSISLMRHIFDEGNIEIIQDFSIEIPDILMDKNKIEQVFVNIFMNSVQAMPDGGKITVRTYIDKFTEPKHAVGRRKEDIFSLGETVVIAEISDTGPGVPEEILRKIFDPFFTTRHKEGGTGLGLSIVENIIDMHKGRIEVKNIEGGGLMTILFFKI